jgi:hypothetical protein
MLHPRFFMIPPGVDWQSGDEFKVLWSSAIADYTLTHWSLSAGVSIRPVSGLDLQTVGESLYIGGNLAVWAWGELPIGKQDGAVANDLSDPRSRISPSLGYCGMSAVIATKLRSPEYRQYL